MIKTIMFILAMALLTGCLAKGPVTGNVYEVKHSEENGLMIKKVAPAATVSE